MSGLGAGVRLAIVDSCRSGALLGRKGGRPGPNFDIRFTDDLATLGEAVLTSSAAHEMALESRDVRGSIFSHHLISGLRGAADSSGDGRVTLAEAYRHAFVHTLLDSSGTLDGPQHPAYDYRLSGQGELVLTEVGARGATLQLPAGFDRILVADGARRVLMAELTGRSANRIALPTGRYVVQARRHHQTYQTELALVRGEVRVLSGGELSSQVAPEATGKGGGLLAPVVEPAPGVGGALLIASLGVVRGAADSMAWLPGLRLEWRGGGGRGFFSQLEIGSGRAEGFRESTARGAAGAFVTHAVRKLRLGLAWRVLGGPLLQSLDADRRFLGWAAGTGPQVSAELAWSRRISLIGSLGAEAVWFRRDGRRTAALWPTAFAGIQLGDR